MPQSYRKRLFWWLFGKPLEIQLVEACEAIHGLRKLGTNDEFEFDYLRILDLANALREELLPRGIVILPNDLECVEDTVITSDGPVMRVRVKTEFTITRGRQKIALCSYGSSIDERGFNIAIAQTFALKSLLKRLSMLFGENDDPEVPRWAHTPETPHQSKRQKEYQERAWKDGVRNSGKTVAEVEALLSEAMGRKLTTEQITSLPSEMFDQAMGILLQFSDLTNLLEMSKLEATKKGPQPVVKSMDHHDPNEIAGD